MGVRYNLSATLYFLLLVLIVTLDKHFLFWNIVVQYFTRNICIPVFLIKSRNYIFLSYLSPHPFHVFIGPHILFYQIWVLLLWIFLQCCHHTSHLSKLHFPSILISCSYQVCHMQCAQKFQQWYILSLIPRIPSINQLLACHYWKCPRGRKHLKMNTMKPIVRVLLFINTVYVAPFIW